MCGTFVLICESCIWRNYFAMFTISYSAKWYSKMLYLSKLIKFFRKCLETLVDQIVCFQFWYFAANKCKAVKELLLPYLYILWYVCIYSLISILIYLHTCIFIWSHVGESITVLNLIISLYKYIEDIQVFSINTW
jgi:hypothetical protein